MALTQDEEKAAKISPPLEAELAKQVQLFKERNIKAPWGSYPSFQTAFLYKKRDSGIDESRLHVYMEGGVLRCDRVTNGKTYTSIIKGTATKEPIDRLLTEIKKKFTKQLRNAWVENRADAENTSAASLRKPMLLHKWEKQKSKIVYPCAVQPKVDGIRCMWDSTTMRLYSRSGKVIDMPHIFAAMVGYPSFDGELAYEDWTIPLPEVIHGIAHRDINIKFHIFDSLETPLLPFSARHITAAPRLLESVAMSPSIILLNIEIANNEQEVDAMYTRAVNAGMEGIVVRNLQSPYEWGKRTMQTLKYKWEIEAMFKIVGYEEVPHPEGNLIMFHCLTNEGAQFDVVPAWKHSERRSMLLWMRAGNKVTQQIKVEYRGITADGIPYHAVGKTLMKELTR